uniref:DNA replication licensing factor MCM5 n=1 Tax=Pyramimonas obovata TaxID=1411642 RepID=A0A7S0RN97_9CHLO|mmetsp:Transcript_38799/g.84440  ORF Transcript_38799/g.84440 Transcript_38799/m.84440 type:complete len:754 (+) Transcript_38799:104-2365(+)
MSGWDEGGVFYSDQGGVAEEDEALMTKHLAQRKFVDFLKSFREFSADGPTKYLNQLDCEPTPKYIKVSMDDIKAHSEDLHETLRVNPAEYLPLLEMAASEVVASHRIARNEALGEEEQVKHDIQILLSSTQNPTNVRNLSSQDISKLVVIPGIVIGASRAKSKGVQITLQCKACKSLRTVACKPGFGGAMMPRTCEARANVQGNIGEDPCPLDPFTVLAERSKYMDHQTLKLQENPEDVPVGEMPRNLLLSVDRSLVQKIVPGTRVTVIGIYSIFQQNDSRKSAGKASVAIRQTYIRVVGLEEDADGNARGNVHFTAEEEEEFKNFASQPNVMQETYKKIAPAIFGADDVKAATACLLFGGARKRLPDGARLRGDVNVLLLGDPSTAKSQLLKFVHKSAPIAVYTSGKGSSAAGLTASVIKDSQSGEAYLEGGAMVLADGGVVCIDEFDKMRAEDRVAIHEAMEQQTISIAKAGITTVLNSRTAVMAAANPPSGRYDDMKTAAENIDLQTTILSRFDLIFIMKDDRSWDKDMRLAKHVLNVHRDASEDAAAGRARAATSSADGPNSDRAPAEPADFDLKRYVQYCRTRYSPCLNENGAEALGREYVRIREEQRKRNHQRKSDEGANPVPITVRQLEALIRISESLAKMAMMNVVTEAHVAEALRLFNISTVDAAKAGITTAVISDEQRQELLQTEAAIKRYLPVGATTSERGLLDLVTRQGHNDHTVRRALMGMHQRGEIEFKSERRKIVRKI